MTATRPPPTELATRWRSKAEDLRTLALESLARAYETCANQLEEACQDVHGQVLTLREAAELSGYSADH